MKKFLQYFLLIIIFSSWGILLTNKSQTHEMVQEIRTVAQKRLKIDRPCSKPLEYSIGSIDSNFSISQDELAQLAAEAANVWNGAEGKVLLKYNPESNFKINLIYDTRQEQSVASLQLEQNLQSLEEADKDLAAQYNSLNVGYKKKIDTYNNDLTEYKKNLEKYNTDVAYWNGVGGAPSDEYAKLKKDKIVLDNEYEKINQEVAEINSLADKTNSLAKKENQVVANYNSTVSTYKSQYGDTQEFEKGVFDGQEIDIYQFKTTADLRLTLVHELGHYIGLPHVENSKSIMYYLIGDQDVNTPTLTAEDRAALKDICKLD